MRYRIQLPVMLLLAAVAAGGQGQKKSVVTGTWEADIGGRTYRLTLAEDQGDVSGTVQLPDGSTTAIEYGLSFGKELEFTTTEGGVEYEWTAEASRNSIKGERLNLDNDSVVRFTAKRAR